MKKISILVILLPLLVIQGCRTQPIPAVASITPTPVITVTLPVYPTVTPPPRHALISWIDYIDGGDEVYTCMQSIGQPQFVLYADGELITRKEQYERAWISPEESTALLDSIRATGLFDRSEEDYRNGWTSITIEDKQFILKFDIPESDPLWRTFVILDDYSNEQLEKFIPDVLRLEIFSLPDLSAVKEAFGEGMPIDGDWATSPLKQFGSGQMVLKGKDVEFVMTQFGGFPEAHIYQNGSSYILAEVCANFDTAGM